MSSLTPPKLGISEKTGGFLFLIEPACEHTRSDASATVEFTLREKNTIRPIRATLGEKRRKYCRYLFSWSTTEKKGWELKKFFFIADFLRDQTVFDLKCDIYVLLFPILGRLRPWRGPMQQSRITYANEIKCD